MRKEKRTKDSKIKKCHPKAPISHVAVSTFRPTFLLFQLTGFMLKLRKDQDPSGSYYQQHF